MKNTRTDKFAPSVIDYSKYVVVGGVEKDFYIDDETGNEVTFANPYISEPVDGIEDFDAFVRAFEIRGIDENVCGVCGHALKYGVILFDLDAKDGAFIGLDCYETYTSVVSGAADALFSARRVANERGRIARIDAFLLANPELVEAYELREYHRILEDLFAKVAAKGTLSEKQVAFAIRLIEDARENRVSAERRAEEEARRAARIESGEIEIAPTGRTTVTGTVIGFKEVESAYGSTLKFLVETVAGYKVWSTVPSAISNVERGDVIEFVADLTPSDDDAYFAFAKRPSKAKILEGAN